MSNRRFTRVNFIPLTAMLLLLVISGCAAGNRSVADLTPAEAEKMIKTNQKDSAFVILDVRTPEEFNTGHLAGAVNVDYRSSDFQSRIDGLPKSRTYLLYCRTGHRSANAMSLMKERGFEKLYNMLGGITRWREENRDIGAN